MRFVGCHLSVGRGFARMMRTASDLGAEVVQYFPKNPRSFRLRVFDKGKLRLEYEASQKLGIQSVCHSPYVTNLSTPDPELRETSIASIVNDLEIAEAYRTPFLVVHSGRHVGEGEARGMELMATAVDEIMSRYEGPVQLLLENTAGQGTELGRSTDELLDTHSRLGCGERVGFCFDTCHAFAAGFFDPERWDEVVAELGREEFESKVRVVHLNDSIAPLGGRRDRHALLGEGALGAELLQRFLRSRLFLRIPVVIETPVAEEAEYAGEIAKVRQWME